MDIWIWTLWFNEFMKYLTKIIKYGLYLLVFILPIQTRWIIKAGQTEYLTYGLYGTDLVLILVLLLFIVYKFSIFNPSAGGQFSNNFQTSSKFWWFIGGLFLMSAVSVFFAANKTLALYKLGWLILGVGLFWLLASANYDRLKLLYAVLAGIFLQAILAGWQFLTQSSFANKWLGLAFHGGADLGVSVIETVGADGAGERWLRSYGGLDHPNILGGVLAAGILLLVGITNKMQNAKFIKFFIHYFLFIIFTAALFFSFSRAAWLALALGIGAMLIEAVMNKNYHAQKNILQAMLISGLVFFILFFQFSNLVIARLSGGERLEVKSANERLESMKNSFLIIKNNYAAGAGIGNYTLALERLRPEQKIFYYQPAHNVFLLAWSETGVFGFIFFIGLIIVIASGRRERSNLTNGESGQKIIVREIASSFPAKFWRGTPRNDNKEFAVMVALLVLLGFDHWLWSLHFGVLFFWLILGLTAGEERKK